MRSTSAGSSCSDTLYAGGSDTSHRLSGRSGADTCVGTSGCERSATASPCQDRRPGTGSLFLVAAVPCSSSGAETPYDVVTGAAATGKEEQARCRCHKRKH